MRLAESGIDELAGFVDTLIVIPNQNLFRVANEKTTFADAFKMADDVLHAGVRSVTDLMMMPGRMCQNGKPVPIQNPDWPGLVQGLRDAGMASYKAGQSKSQDNVLMAADMLVTACSNCHDKYREKPGGEKDRCR